MAVPSQTNGVIIHDTEWNTLVDAINQNTTDISAVRSTANNAATSAALSTEVTNRSNGDTNEANTRASADTALGNRIAVFENADACYAYQSASQNVTTNTAVTLDAELFDSNTMHDNATNNTRITIKTSGVYVVSGMVGFSGNTAGGRRIAMVWKNGAQIPGALNLMAPAGNNAWNTAVSTPAIPVNLVAGDYLQLVAYQDSGAALALAVTAGYNSFLSVLFQRPPA